MKRCVFTLLIVLFSVSYVISQNREIKIIPEPVEVKTGKGSFVINAGTVVVAEGKDSRLAGIRQWFLQRLSSSTGLKIKSAGKADKNAVVLSLLPQFDKALGEEGYHLEVTPSLINISANKPAGIFYGLQTLLQLLPPEVNSPTPVTGIAWNVPSVQITDYPRFGWRGILLDVSRHFFSKEEVLHFIDEIALYKYNLLHLHLTDDNGWRIEIKSLPRLTEFGAWRVERTGRWGTFTPPLVYEPTTYGGFYTQDDIKEIVAYASDRFVNILPEIDVPAHSLALI
ncbi:MAG TPA: family 20 glycosylhydrolase, partial [Bacteroidales bacterium]|nr:family 20 glycosylhydrolase [Bacteroidales bacterium]